MELGAIVPGTLFTGDGFSYILEVMRMRKKALKIGILVLAAAFLLAQTIRTERSNPPISSDISCDPGVRSLLRKACYDCHSNETIWPWYSGIAPFSWLVTNDVREARRHLNFSEWGGYDSDTRLYKLKGIAEEVREGEMPLWYYSIVHKGARLDAAERDRILSWAEAASQSAEPKR